MIEFIGNGIVLFIVIDDMFVVRFNGVKGGQVVVCWCSDGGWNIVGNGYIFQFEYKMVIFWYFEIENGVFIVCADFQCYFGGVFFLLQFDGCFVIDCCFMCYIIYFGFVVWVGEWFFFEQKNCFVVWVEIFGIIVVVDFCGVDGIVGSYDF